MRPRRKPRPGYQLTVLDFDLARQSRDWCEAELTRHAKCAICPEWSPRGFVMLISTQHRARVFRCDPEAHAAYYDALERAATLRA